MQYDERIDACVIEELNCNNRISYLTLKDRVEKLLGRTLSFDTYNNHLRRMQAENIISKEDKKERGKKVFYSMTEQAKKQQRLDLLAVSPKQPYSEVFMKKYSFLRYFIDRIYL